MRAASAGHATSRGGREAPWVDGRRSASGARHRDAAAGLDEGFVGLRELREPDSRRRQSVHVAVAGDEHQHAGFLGHPSRAPVFLVSRCGAPRSQGERRVAHVHRARRGLRRRGLDCSEAPIVSGVGRRRCAPRHPRASRPVRSRSYVRSPTRERTAATNARTSPVAFPRHTTASWLGSSPSTERY